MSRKNTFYDRVGKDIRKWIDKEYPEDRKVSSGKRGVTSRFEDNDLQEIALEVKKELRGEKVYPSLLEEITGIGRQTWKRRINNFLEELNTPIVEGREFGIEEHDEIDHINIDLIVERYGRNPKQLVNHLYQIEESRIRLYGIIKELKKENETLLKVKNDTEKLMNENEKLKNALAHYYLISNTLTVSSYFPDLRRELGIEDNLMDLNNNPEKSSDISNLNQLFPSSKEVAATTNDINEILKPKGKKVGKELFDELMDEFGDIIDE
jgi:molybdopterin converting factor small subunit